MLIGIDMLCIQSPQGADREVGRYARQLVSSLLANDSNHRYVLYTHEGMPTDRIPSARNSLRVSLAPRRRGSALLRPTIQRILDQNPDGLDWLLLLDPFEPNYGGMPPESPLNPLKVASLILGLPTNQPDDQRLAPLHRHDVLFGVSEATAAATRTLLGRQSRRVTTLGLAVEPAIDGNLWKEPVTRFAAEELGQLGITGPFLFANVDRGTTSANLRGILDAHRRLPTEIRQRHQLVIAGVVDDPWGVVGFLHEQDCAEGLVLVGEVDEPTLQTLYGRSSAFVSPSVDDASGLALVQAMSCGAAVIAGRSGSQPQILGDACLLADSANPQEIAYRITEVLANPDLQQNLRQRSQIRSARFAWAPVIDGLLARLEAVEPTRPRPRIRRDKSHAIRPRIAIFPEISQPGQTGLNLGSTIPEDWRQAYQVDLYLDPGDSSMRDSIPPQLGCFDARQFDRNDEILSYHAVLYQFSDREYLDFKLERLRSRPGLVFLLEPIDLEQDMGQLREVFLTWSKVVVGSRQHDERIRSALPEFADQIVLRPSSGSSLIDEIERCSSELGRGPGRRSRSISGVSRPMGIKRSGHDASGLTRDPMMAMGLELEGQRS